MEVSTGGRCRCARRGGGWIDTETAGEQTGWKIYTRHDYFYLAAASLRLARGRPDAQSPGDTRPVFLSHVHVWVVAAHHVLWLCVVGGQISDGFLRTTAAAARVQPIGKTGTTYSSWACIAATSQSKTVAAVVSAARMEYSAVATVVDTSAWPAAQRNGRRRFSFPMHSGGSAWIPKSGRTPKLLSPIKSVQDPVLLRRCCRAGGGVVHGIFSCQTARIRPNPNSKQPQPRNSMAIKHGQRSKPRWLPLLLSLHLIPRRRCLLRRVKAVLRDMCFLSI